MSQNFLGQTYILRESENFDEYMKELGVGLVLRKMGNTLISKCVLNKCNHTTYTFTLETPYRCTGIYFQLGKEFTERTLDNRVVETVCYLKDNVFIQKQGGPKPTKIVREFKNDKLITTLTVGDVKAIRVYEALQIKSEDKCKFLAK